MKRPLGTIGLTFLTVLAVAFHYQSTALWIVLCSAGGLALAAGVFMAVKKFRRASLFIITGCAALMALLSLFLYQNIYYQPVIDNYSDKELNVTAYVCDEITHTNRYTIVPIKTLKIDGEEKQVKMNLWYNSDYPLREYDCFSAVINTSSADTNYNKSRGIFFNIFQIDNLKVKKDRHYDIMTPAVYARLAMKRSLSQCMSKDGAAICKAVIFGDKTALSKKITDSFNSTGTTFLIVVSGLHLSVAVAAFSVLLKLFRRKKLTAAASIAGIVCFTALTGFTPSVSRAAIGAGLLYLGHIINRTSDGITSLGIAALALGLSNPFSVGNIGMLMSFSAVLGIHLWAKPIHDRMAKLFRADRIRINVFKAYSMGSKRLWVYQKGMRAVKETVDFFIALAATSISASLWISPISVLALGKLSPLVVIISLISEPLASLILVFALIAALINLVPFLSLLALPFAAAADLLSKALINFNCLFAALPVTSVKTDAAFWYVWLGITAVLVIIGYLFKKRGRYVALAAALSAITLASGWSIHTLTQTHETRLVLIHSNGGTTVAVNKADTLSVISLAGNKTKTSAVTDELKSYDDEIDNVIILNTKYSLNYLYAMYDEFDVACSYFDSEVTENFRASESAKPHLISEASVTEIALNSDTCDTILKTPGGEFQYLAFGGKTALFIPKNTDLSALDVKYLSPDYAVMEGVPENVEALSCDTLIYSGTKGKKYNNNYDKLQAVCNSLRVLKTETVVL